MYLFNIIDIVMIVKIILMQNVKNYVMSLLKILEMIENLVMKLFILMSVVMVPGMFEVIHPIGGGLH